ncbi:2-aminomuconic semialdehyde dehydrogenase-like [Hyalella azteca]|uniref:2-aminomuconic semialdehyde dehydrogenase-like n=1 Tax=Hyalella azteca TaxID=294128 RepID=A0A8B7P3M9_HYAAZ|nr:2-aminomuconic semialdehyde dehydrogenase-like [Hyalella azteca]
MAAAVQELQNFIDGKFEPWSGPWIRSVNPATGVHEINVPDSGSDEVNAAVDAATRALPGWRALSCAQRAEYMTRVADLLDASLQQFAEAESRDQGKPVWLAAKVDIPRAVLNFRHFAAALPHLLGTSKILSESQTVNYTTREAVGVAGLISPWNLPLYLLTFKIAPALMSGCTVVAKPSELTSLTAFMLCQLFVEAGVPAGVLNMVFGSGAAAGSALTQHPDVPLISFTGSTATGATIASITAPLFKKLSLEMGGKNAALVFSDCDLNKTVATLVRSSFINQGQVCLCTSRIYVHSRIYDEFLDKFVAAVKKLKVGSPDDDSSYLGPLNSAQHLAKVRQCVVQAVKDGGRVLCGETRDELQLPPQCANGFFMAPTVITDVPEESQAMKEEIFGPVTCVRPFSTEEEVVRAANGVRYGLCAAVFTQDLGTAHRVAHALQVGTVWTNCWLVRDLDLPFGGMKQSGLGREGTHESWDFFTQQKTICLQIS